MPRKPSRMDERVALDMDPEDAIRALLAVDPAGLCDQCSHPTRLHRVTKHGRLEGVTCQVDDCDCHYERKRTD